MNQSTEKRTPDAAGLSSLYTGIREELAQVGQLLRLELTSEYPLVHKLAQHAIHLASNRLQPALLLLSGKLCGKTTDDHIELAASVEMLHIASLIHDNVLDEAALRRRVDSVNARWSNDTNILLGDYLCAKSLCLAASIENPYAVQSLLAASQRKCEGELRQVGARGDCDLSEAECLQIVDGKTGALCACCCEMGAYYAGASTSEVVSLTRFGAKLGAAIQIIDDVLDIVGDENATGKSSGTDLLKLKPTLPLVRLLAESSSGHKATLTRILTTPSNRRKELLGPWLKDSDAIGYARQKAETFGKEAAAELAVWPSTPIREALIEIARFVIDRHY